MASAAGRTWRTWLFMLLTYVGSDRLLKLKKTSPGRLIRRIAECLLASGSIHVRGGPAFGLRLTGRLLDLDHRQGYGLVRGVLETEVQEALRRHVGPGAVVFDVGANIGFFSLLSAKLAGREGCVVAFEPVPRNAAAVRANAALNAATVDVRECAVADRSGLAELCVPTELSWSHLTDHGLHPDTQLVLPVQVVALDQEISARNLSVPDVVKIDVEGAELEVLNGLRETLVRNDVTVICELHSSNAAVLRLAHELGYSVANLEGTADVADAGPIHVLLSKRRSFDHVGVT
jgi:FkbM family methyltransferase